MPSSRQVLGDEKELAKDILLLDEGHAQKVIWVFEFPEGKTPSKKLLARIVELQQAGYDMEHQLIMAKG